MFVPIIEQRKKDEYDYYIDYYLKELKKANIDAIILGCTHYPSLKENIENYLNIPCIDMGVLVSSTINESNNKGLELYFSLVNNDIIENVKELIGDYQVVERRL
jgi:glutamate racemase